MNEIIGIIPHKFRRRGFGVACTLLLRAGLNFLGLAVLLPVLALALDARSLDGGGQLARIYTALGFTSPRSFALTVCAAVVAVIVLKCLTNLWLARIERNYIYDLYRTLSRRLYVTYHDRGLPFVKSSNSAVLARNVNVVCLAFTAGVLKPAAAIAAEALLLALLFGALLWYAPVAAALAVAVFLPSVWIYYGLVRTEGIRRSAATAKTPKSSCVRPSSAPRLSATSRAMPSASPISVKACGSMPIAVSRRRVRIT